jgi:salicylate hydroxylase
MALEDGWVLAALLARHDTLAEAIAAYERLRAPRCARIVGESTRAAGIYHLRDPWRGIVHGAIGVANRVVPKLIARRYDWIHRHDVTRDVL